MGLFQSDLTFDNDVEPEIAQQMVLAAGGYRFANGYSVRAAAGAILGGTLEHQGRTHDVDPGWALTAALSRNWSFGERFFATASLTAGVSSTTTREREPGGAMGEEIDLRALDFRLGGVVGVTVAERFSPYLLARGFGGPVMWQLDGEDVTGSDQYHYQVGAGASVALPWSLSLLVDASVLGERAVSLGVSAEL